ncbi:fibronectin type III domain-containing protein [Candidatus Bipolaricaulota bacterium]
MSKEIRSRGCSVRLTPVVAGVLLALCVESAIAQTEDVLSAPASVEASDSVYTDRIEVRWSPVDGATHYEIHRSTFLRSMYIPMATINQTKFEDEALKASQYYYYKVRACQEDGCGPFSEPDIGSWDIKIPTGVSATRGRYPDKIRISWDRVTGATLYYVYRAPEEDGAYSVLSMVYKTTFDDSGASAGTIHYYRIRALTTSTGSDLSLPVTGYRDAILDVSARFLSVTEAD